MSGYRIHIDNRVDHNALMEQLCRQAAAGLAKQIDLTNDPRKREVLHRRMRDREVQSERHRQIVEELRRFPRPGRGVNLIGHS